MIMSFFSTTSVLWASGLALGWLLYGRLQEHKHKPSHLPLPPGPRGYPFIDNLLDFPTSKAWLAYDQWSKMYGDMVYFKVLGQPFLVLGSLEKAYDLFERRSSNYSDRIHLPMLAELMEWNWNFALMPYGTVWRRYRRAFHDHFHPNVVHKYHDVYVGTARAFLRRLLKTPDDFMLHVRHAFASTILKITYGMIISDDNDDSYVKTAEIALSSASEAGIPGRFLVDIFPAMKYIPAWVPGAGWKRKANYWRQISRKFVNMPWESVKERMKDGTAEPCVATALIEKLLDENSPNWQDGDSMARNICAMSFAGGADTTVSTVQSYFMAMALYPEVQKKAQEELDRVLGGRLPEFNDRPNLPYINAMVKESMRWQPVTPVGLAHMASEADEYNGYYIPKGTIIMGNTWSILHDPEIYEDPLTYNPERFLKDGKIDPTVRNPTVASFGYGRRIFPGRFLAEDSMFITISHILSVYDVRPSLDKDGKEIPIKPEMTNGTLSYPEPFVCRITPRSIHAEELIRNSGLMD